MKEKPYLDTIIEDLFLGTDESNLKKEAIIELWERIITSNFPRVINPSYLAERLVGHLENKQERSLEILSDLLNNILREACAAANQLTLISGIKDTLSYYLYNMGELDPTAHKYLVINNLQAQPRNDPHHEFDNFHFAPLSNILKEKVTADQQLLLFSTNVMSLGFKCFEVSLIDVEQFFFIHRPEMGNVRALFAAIAHVTKGEVRLLLRVYPDKDKPFNSEPQLYFDKIPEGLSQQEAIYFTNLFYDTVISRNVISNQFIANTLLVKATQALSDQFEFSHIVSSAEVEFDTTHYYAVFRNKF